MLRVRIDRIEGEDEEDGKCLAWKEIGGQVH